MFTSLDSPLTLLGTHTKYKGALFSVKKINNSEAKWPRETHLLQARCPKLTNLVLYILIEKQGVDYKKMKKKRRNFNKTNRKQLNEYLCLVCILLRSERMCWFTY